MYWRSSALRLIVCAGSRTTLPLVTGVLHSDIASPLLAGTTVRQSGLDHLITNVCYGKEWLLPESIFVAR